MAVADWICISYSLILYSCFKFVFYLEATFYPGHRVFLELFTGLKMWFFAQ